MPRTSKVRRLPPELREQLHAMLDAGHTLEEITAHLKALGADVSRSGLGRYKQQVDKVRLVCASPAPWPRPSWSVWAPRPPPARAARPSSRC